ncbi:MAG: RDD family protein [Bauldia sp.]
MTYRDATAPYAGFWVRFVALILDGIIVGAVFSILNPLVFGTSYWDLDEMYSLGNTWLGAVLQAAYVWTMWYFFGATLGKMALRLRVVSADTLGYLSFGQVVGRWFAQILSAIPLLLGFIWAAFDPRKQAWHDKLAGTFVLAETPGYPRRPAGEAR